MVFKLISEEKNELEPDRITSSPTRERFKEGFKDIAKGAESVGHQLATGLSEVSSQGHGYLGNLFSFANQYAAAPLQELITGKPSLPYEETSLGKIFPTSSQVKQEYEKSLPYLKPRNKYENFTNDLFGTASVFLTPGGQSQIGRFARMNPYSRAFIKSLGVNLAGEGTESLTGSKEKGDLARMGAFFLMSGMDNPGAQQYISQSYNRANQALQQAGNPSVNSTGLLNRLQNLRTRLTTGTLAPSEQAVVTDIDRVMGHIQGNEIPVENLWGSLRSINENSLLARRSAAGRQGRLRARNLYNELSGIVRNELRNYGDINPNFGIPFNEAQNATRALHQSNAIARTIESISGSDFSRSGLLHLFGGAAGATAAKMGHLTPQNAMLGGGYQAAKILYRMVNSPLLRRHYFNALRAGVRENVPQMSKELNKMEKIIEEENKEEKPIRIKKSNK